LRLVVVLVLAICAFGALAYTFPALTGRIVDQANVIPPAARASIEAKLKALENKSGIQFVVATVNSLEGDEIEPYANALFREWKLGEKTKNNGVLLLVAPKEHRVRIEAGYGLEGTLTDALSKVIISNAIVPRLKAGDFGGGIERGVDDTITVLTTDASDWQKKPELRVDRQDTAVDDIMPFIVLAIFIFIVFSILRSPQRGNILSFLLGALMGSGGRSSYGGGYGDSGGFSDWGGFSDDGGFSGGGGSSGGGGASGSW
jgi:uncharacterized protein